MIAFTCAIYAQEDTTAVKSDSVADAAPREATLSKEQVARIVEPKSKRNGPLFLPGLFLGTSYASSGGLGIGMGVSFLFTQSWPVAIGFEPFHLQIGAKDFQVVSDETLWLAVAGLVFGAMGPLFAGDSSKEPVNHGEESRSVAKTVLGLAALVPMYAYCGSLYVPFTPGTWLGIIDRSRFVTQLISEGFHKRSFTYMNDLGLRLSPFAHANVLGVDLEGGMRFEKNFAKELKYRYYMQLGISIYLIGR
ncbi:MAG: hypothetical protein HUK20_03235 [Fibrobacter sp.]|nr:hypothetical protein [Fibrobacter sp.]